MARELIPAQQPKKQLSPDSDRTAPALWVREVWFLRKFEADGVLRRISLRRGLNILWSKPTEGDTPLFENEKLSGHTAGKSTFCRILRWLLGEASFGDEGLQTSIRRGLGDGGAAAEIVVNGRTWLVWRQFAKYSQPHCCPDSGLDELFSPDLQPAPFSDYLAALASLVDQETKATILPAARKPISWGHILPWLTRDQDCHLSSPLKWRDTASDSNAMGTSAADRVAITRAVMHTLGSEEEELGARNTDLRKQIGQAKELLIGLRHQANADLQRVRDCDGVVIDPSFPQFSLGELMADCERQLVKLKAEREEANDAKSLRDLQAELTQAARKRASAETAITQDEEHLELDRLTLKNLRGTLQADEEKRMLALLDAPLGRCNVLLEVAKARGCRMAHGRSIDFATEVELRNQQNEIQAYTEGIRCREADLARRRSALDRLKADEKEAGDRLRAAMATWNRTLWAVADKERRYTELKALAERADRAISESLAQPAKIKSLEKDQRDVQDELHDVQREQQRTRTSFIDSLTWIVQALQGTDASVKYEPGADSIRIAIVNDGERVSSGMKALGVLAFDLAALLCSCEGQGCHPRFIIHDSPREADLEAHVYRKVFRWVVEELEAAYEGREPAFQYIITTTEPPPSQYRTHPWLIDPVLDASTPKGRLFGVNL